MSNVYVTNTAAAIEITGRFFEAMDYLVAARIVRGYKTVTDLWGIDRRNLAKLKAEPQHRTLKPEYIYYLERDYGISSRWVVTGRGRMLLPSRQTDEQNRPKMQ
ncbi:MAG: hypothetical protein IJR77_03755 [Bacteroidales bacterium]|nr:hypothetical protein [Bacteroidales bacterium]